MATVERKGTRSLRGELAEFINEILDSEDEVSLDNLISRTEAHFSGDEWVREALVREGLKAMIPSIVQRVRHSLRRSARHIDDRSRRERISSVFEYVGDGFSKSILAMRRPEHLFVATEREQAAAGHLRWAGFHRAVAKLHTDDRTPTADLDSGKVSSLWQEHIERD